MHGALVRPVAVGAAALIFTGAFGQEKYELSDTDDWNLVATVDPSTPAGQLAIARKALAADENKRAASKEEYLKSMYTLTKECTDGTEFARRRDQMKREYRDAYLCGQLRLDAIQRISAGFSRIDVVAATRLPARHRHWRQQDRGRAGTRGRSGAGRVAAGRLGEW